MMQAPRYSLVIPCYNEARNLPALASRTGQLTAARSGLEVVFVDNGSTDGSSELLASLLPVGGPCRTLRVEKNQGYGFGILSGLQASRGSIIGWTHADMQTDPMDALRGFELFDQGSSRLFVKGRRSGRPAADVFFTVGMSAFETALLGRPLWDINAQPTLFAREFFESWENPPWDFSLDLFAYYRARSTGLEVRRFPVRFGERLHGVSHWNVDWRAKRKFIKRTVEFSLELRRAIRK